MKTREEIIEMLMDEQRRVVGTSRELFYDIVRKEGNSHGMLSDTRAFFKDYGFSYHESWLNISRDMTYKQLKEQREDEFESHVKHIGKCLEAGFLI